MPLHASYIDVEDRLDLSFSGNLDVTLSEAVWDICKQVPTNLVTCVVDLSEVERLFDSGLALLQMLFRRLNDLGVIVVFLSDCPEIRERISVVTQRGRCPIEAQ